MESALLWRYAVRLLLAAHISSQWTSHSLVFNEFFLDHISKNLIITYRDFVGYSVSCTTLNSGSLFQMRKNSVTKLEIGKLMQYEYYIVGREKKNLFGASTAEDISTGYVLVAIFKQPWWSRDPVHLIWELKNGGRGGVKIVSPPPCIMLKKSTHKSHH